MGRTHKKVEICDSSGIQISTFAFIKIMERVKLINGGTLTLESEPGVYTKVIVTQFI